MKFQQADCTKENAEALVTKWIKDERQYRAQVKKAMLAGTPFQGMLARADQLAECRRAMQEALGLVAIAVP